MHKAIYLIRGLDHESYDSFAGRISALAGEVTQMVSTLSLRYTLTRESPPRLSVIPFSRKKLAAISVYKNDSTPVDLLISQSTCAEAYSVEEALPVAYSKYWADGLPTPGACLLTLFSRKRDIDHATFIDRWHHSHTPMSLRFHPLWNYNRNVVVETIKAGSGNFEGIVEEQVRTRQELLNPFTFFGNPLVILPRMLMVYVDTKSFIDYATMETYLTAEYVIKSQNSF